MDAIRKLDGSDSVDIIYDVKQTKQWYLPYNFYVPMGCSFFFLLKGICSHLHCIRSACSAPISMPIIGYLYSDAVAMRPRQ